MSDKYKAKTQYTGVLNIGHCAYKLIPTLSFMNLLVYWLLKVSASHIPRWNPSNCCWCNPGSARHGSKIHHDTLKQSQFCLKPRDNFYLPLTVWNTICGEVVKMVRMS